MSKPEDFQFRQMIVENLDTSMMVEAGAGSGKTASLVDRMLALIDGAVIGYRPFFPVRLVVFPEFAHAAPIYASVRELRDKLAVPVPNEHVERYVAKAREHGIYIQTGSFIELDPAWPGVLFNSTCLSCCSPRSGAPIS